MKVCFVILTCEAYFNTRVKWLLETCLKDVEKNDLYFLSAKSIEPNIYGWNTPDNYESCPLKYVRFFQNLKLDYDWYYFMDDDTFVFPERLYKFLSYFNEKDSLYMGRRCDHISYPIYMSGGAGFIISKPLYLELVNFIRNTSEDKLFPSIHGDLSLGHWLSNIPKKIIESKLFNSSLHKDENELKNCISFHYLKIEQHYKFYHNIM